MASITDHVIKLQELTQKNLDILQALNDSFFTNQNHLSVNVGENQYAIPSFISLENKLNSLTANFHNLVKAPETGEAFFNFSGNSRAIAVRSYTTTPNSLVLGKIENFEVEQNDIFKDFLTPNPYIHLNTFSLPNDTTQVMVKKIIPLTSDLINEFESRLVEIDENSKTSTYKKSIQFPYKDLYKILSLYTQDVDYIEYDTKIDLPIRKNIGTGTYAIQEIIEDRVDENLINYITIKLRSDLDPDIYMSSLKYRLFDETLERPLAVGDQLVTFEGNAKMEITDIQTNTNTITVKVLHGEFVNLMPSYTNQERFLVDLNKLRFYSPIDFNKDKYVKVPLEEDRFIFVAIAALNSRMNVQSSWGTGLMIDTYSLTNDEQQTFKSYYDENVRNVGDVLFEITTMMSNTLTKYTKEEYERFTGYKPILDPSTLTVTQINDHLNNSKTVQHIRSLYSQKKELENQLNTIQGQINNYDQTLSTTSFDDTINMRDNYISSLYELYTRRNEISTSITKIIDEIAISANNSELPIENAKYRIRGHFDPKDVVWKDHIKGIRVHYKYKNVNATNTNDTKSISEEVFSDWNEMVSIDRFKSPIYNDNKHQYVSEYQEQTSGRKYNQIDIPITQGEVVDIKLKLVYDFGYPFVLTTSEWSDTITIDFPDEYLKDIKILDIIAENNNDIETNRFNNIIKDSGISTHVEDKVTDQDITYFHKPEHIASGFYTSERRIIPLKDKLETLNNLLVELRDEVYGTNTESLKVTLSNAISSTTLSPYVNNTVYPLGYKTVCNNPQMYDGDYEVMDIKNGAATIKVVSTIFKLALTNDSEHVVKLFSLFAGDKETPLNKTRAIRKYDVDDFCVRPESTPDSDDNFKGVWFEQPTMSENEDSQAIQGCNQYLYFRIKDLTTGENLYDDNAQGKLKLSKGGMKFVDSDSEIYRDDICIYPKLATYRGLCIGVNTNLVINPKESIVIPIVVEYCLSSESSYKCSISFDILPSLYKDPINYKATFIIKPETTIHDNVIAQSNNKSNGEQIKYIPIYK